MSGVTDNKFDEIIQRAISDARGVHCSPEEYIDALKGWIEEIEVEIYAAKESKASANRKGA